MLQRTTNPIMIMKNRSNFLIEEVISWNVSMVAVDEERAAGAEAADGFFSVVGLAGFVSRKVPSISKMSASCGIF
jgi:hypothetical protein